MQKIRRQFLKERLNISTLAMSPPTYNINILYFEIQWRKAIFCNDKARMTYFKLMT